MTITFLTPIDLKPIVENLLTAELGTYTYQNGYSTTAISVGNPINVIKVNGLECIIDLYPTILSYMWLNDTTIVKQQWTITLIQREGTNLIPATEKLMAYFWKGDGKYIPQDLQTETYEQYRFNFIYEALKSNINIIK